MKLRQSAVTGSYRPPQAGELKHRLTIRRVVDIPAADFEVTQEYHDVIKVWGKLTPVSGAVYIGSMQVDDTITHKALIRWRPLSSDHQIVYAGAEYRVKRVTPLNGERIWALLELEELRRDS